jgi:hypothetical protein
LRDGRDISATNETSVRLGEKVARRIPGDYNDWPAGVAPSKISSEWMTANAELTKSNRRSFDSLRSLRMTALEREFEADRVLVHLVYPT